MYIETERIVVNNTVGVEDGIVAFVGDFDPEAPSLSISIPFILLVGRILIDEIPDVLIDHGADPSVGSGIELKPLLTFALVGSYLHFFAGNGTIYFICCGLLDRFGGECFFWG